MFFPSKEEREKVSFFSLLSLNGNGRRRVVVVGKSHFKKFSAPKKTEKESLVVELGGSEPALFLESRDVVDQVSGLRPDPEKR